MIRINLLGQAKPKASRRPVDTGAALPVLFIGAGILFGALILGYVYYNWQHQLTEENAKIKQLADAENRPGAGQASGRSLRKTKGRPAAARLTIEQLQRDRTGGQELLDQIASTVSRTENLWLTSMVKKDNNLTLEGASASVNGVANFITALKRSGYFSNIEIKESKQDEKAAAMYRPLISQISAQITPPGAPAPATTAKPASAPGSCAAERAARPKVG